MLFSPFVAMEVLRCSSTALSRKNCYYEFKANKLIIIWKELQKLFKKKKKYFLEVRILKVNESTLRKKQPSVD